MKRILIIFILLSLVFSLGACGLDISTPAASTPESSQPPEAPVFQEQIVVDNEYCTIKITGIEDSSLWGYTLNLYLENKSPDTAYMMSVSNASVNGVQADPFFAAEVAPGKKANKEISFSDSLFAEDIGSYSDIFLKFRVYDSNDWLSEPVAEPEIHIYPLGAENAALYSRPAQATDIILVDNEFVTAIITGYRMDDIWGYTADLFLINKTDTAVMFSVDEVSVNGFMLDPFYAHSVDADMCSFSSISWSESAFAENGITSVEAIEFIFRAYDCENLLDEDFFDEVITLTP